MTITRRYRYGIVGYRYVRTLRVYLQKVRSLIRKKPFLRGWEACWAAPSPPPDSWRASRRASRCWRRTWTWLRSPRVWCAAIVLLPPAAASAAESKWTSKGYDQWCESGMFIPDPGSWFLRYPFRIPDLKTATEERGEKKFVVKPFFVATNISQNWKLFLFFQMLKKKIWASFQRIIELFTQKFVIKL